MEERERERRDVLPGGACFVEADTTQCLPDPLSLLFFTRTHPVLFTPLPNLIIPIIPFLLYTYKLLITTKNYIKLSQLIIFIIYFSNFFLFLQHTPCSCLHRVWS